MAGPAGTIAGFSPCKTTAASRWGRSIFAGDARQRRIELRTVVPRPRVQVLAREPELEPPEAPQRREPVTGAAGSGDCGRPVGPESDVGRLQAEDVAGGDELHGLRERGLRARASLFAASACERPPT